MANPPVMQMRRPFDPVAHDLDESFRLTKFVDIRGKCKVPQEVVLKLVEGLKVSSKNSRSMMLPDYLCLSSCLSSRFCLRLFLSFFLFVSLPVCLPTCSPIFPVALLFSILSVCLELFFLFICVFYPFSVLSFSSSVFSSCIFSTCLSVISFYLSLLSGCLFSCLSACISFFSFLYLFSFVCCPAFNRLRTLPSNCFPSRLSSLLSVNSVFLRLPIFLPSCLPLPFSFLSKFLVYQSSCCLSALFVYVFAQSVCRSVCLSVSLSHSLTHSLTHSLSL